MRQVFLEKGAVVVKEVCQPVMDDYAVLVAVHHASNSSSPPINLQTNTA